MLDGWNSVFSLFQHHMFKMCFLDVIDVQGPPGQKGDQGATEIIDYNGNIQEALQVRVVT